MSRPLIFSSAGGRPISVADVDALGDPVRVTLTAINGTLTLSRTTGLVFVLPADGTADATMTFTGTIVNVNAALDGVSFSPSFGFSGVGGLTITTNDQGHAGAGGALSDTDGVSITVGRDAFADLALAMTDAPDPVAVGGGLTYSIRVSNNGPLEAPNVMMTDTLPSSVIFISATANTGLCTFVSASGTVRCDLGVLANGSSDSITVVVRTTQRGTTTNRASVSANQSDRNTANNTAVVQTAVR